MGFGVLGRLLLEEVLPRCQICLETVSLAAEAVSSITLHVSRALVLSSNPAPPAPRNSPHLTSPIHGPYDLCCGPRLIKQRLHLLHHLRGTRGKDTALVAGFLNLRACLFVARLLGAAASPLADQCGKTFHQVERDEISQTRRFGFHGRLFWGSSNKVPR